MPPHFYKIINPLFLYVPLAYLYFNFFFDTWNSFNLISSLLIIPFVYLGFILFYLHRYYKQIQYRTLFFYTLIPTLLSSWILAYFLSGMDHTLTYDPLWQQLLNYTIGTFFVGLLLWLPFWLVSILLEMGIRKLVIKK